MPLSILGISGSVRRPSRTSELVRAILAAIHRGLGADSRLIESRLIELADAATPLCSTLPRAEAGVTAEAIIRSVETADSAIYATEADFAGDILTNPAVTERIGRTADDVIRLLDTRPAPRRERIVQLA
jgi:hypothetical protein